MSKIVTILIILAGVLVGSVAISGTPMSRVVKVAAAADGELFESEPAWPLCGHIADDPPAEWEEEDGCPSERWGSADYSDFPLSSTFGPRQLVSGGYRYDFHRGIDIPAATGTPVFAIADGVVRKAGLYSSYTEPLVQLRHYRLGSTSCKSGSGCYHTLYLHISGWTVSEGDGVSKGDLIGYVGASSSGFEHLHFELRDAVAADPYSSWQRDAVHPLSVLPYNDGDEIALTIDEVSQVATEIEVTATLTIAMDQLDFQRVDVSVYEVQEDDSLTLVEQAGDTSNDDGYNVYPAWFDVELWNRQYTHKDSSKFPWSSFDTCPYEPDHASSYDAHVHMDQQDADDHQVGSFNGVKIAPEHYNASSDAEIVTFTFNELTSTADASNTCIVVTATDVKGGTTTQEYNCP